MNTDKDWRGTHPASDDDGTAKNLGPIFCRDLAKLRRRCKTARAYEARHAEFTNIISPQTKLAKAFVSAASAISSPITAENILPIWRLAQADLSKTANQRIVASWLKAYFDRAEQMAA